MLKRRFIKLAAAVAVIAPALGFTSLSATAVAKPASLYAAGIPAAAPAGCPSGDVCIYSDANYGNGGPGIPPGLFKETNENWGPEFGSSHGACTVKTAAPDNEGGWNDCVSSIYNNTSANFYFYVNTDCSSGGGFQLEVAAGSGRSDLNTDIGSHGTGYFNDSLTSDRRGSAGSC